MFRPGTGETASELIRRISAATQALAFTADANLRQAAPTASDSLSGANVQGWVGLMTHAGCAPLCSASPGCGVLIAAPHAH